MEQTKPGKELLIRLKNGDMAAFDAVYEKYCKRLYGFAIRYLKQKQDAEEIVQDVFIKIWNARETINLSSSFESFLFTVAYNTTISQLRKRLSEKKYVEHVTALQQPGLDHTSPEESYDHLKQTVQVLLEQLTPRQKEVFLLSRQDNLTHEEIAAKLNISVNTVKNHLVAALDFLRSNLNNSMIINFLYLCLFL
ncbi:MAG: RNA polymerase sigma-70 factor [Bacteroidales bacterium]|nr:RNA polymerase sigma-70 factor [Bacteroidales bacterium]